MEDIVKRLMENHHLNEMAYDRSDAIDRCASLGRRFIEHFEKVVELGKDDKDFNHHCHEMQVWFDDVKDIVLRQNKKRLSNDQIVNWFFTRGSSLEYLFKDESISDLYDTLMIELLSSSRSKKVVDIMRSILDN